MTTAVWTPRAQKDLARIDDYYRPRDPRFADRFGQDALATARFLAEFPRSAAAIGNGKRKRGVPRSDHVLIYRVRREQDQILRVRHAKEGWRPL